MELKDINTKMRYTNLSVYLISLSIKGPDFPIKGREFQTGLKKLKLKVKNNQA